MLRTGSLGLDILLGGGWKPGTVNEIWGPPGSGKSTLALHTAWELQWSQTTLWVSLGTEVPIRDFRGVFTVPEDAEHAFWTMENAASIGAGLIVVDSANGLVRRRELLGDPDYVPHPQREYKDELNSLKAACQKSGTIVLFLSKPRDRDRQPVRGTGISEKARDRVQLQVVHQHQDETRDIRVSVKGNDDHTTFTVEPGTGIDWVTELFRLGVRYGLIENRGAWYTVNGQIVHGIRQGADYIRDNTHTAVVLDEQIRSLAGI